MLISLCALGCSRDTPLFATGDAGLDAGPGGGGLALVPIRRDAGPEPAPDIAAICATACGDYVGCGVIDDCNTGDAAWIERVCVRGCPSREWAREVRDAPNCRTIIDIAHAERDGLASACSLDQKVCDDYANTVVACIGELCPGVGGMGRMRSEFLRACEESVLSGEITSDEATRVAATPCSDTGLRRAVRRYIDAELDDACADDPPPVGGLDPELCGRGCTKQTFANCLPDDPPAHMSDPDVCQQRCTTEGDHAALYTCLAGQRSCAQINFCREHAGEDCTRVCAVVAECAGGGESCSGVNRRGQAAFFEGCYALCGDRTAFVAAIDNAPACAGKVDFVTGASPDLSAACGD